MLAGSKRGRPVLTESKAGNGSVQARAARIRMVAPQPPVVLLHSCDLLRGAREIVIEHNHREYRLRITAQEKLILTA